MGGGASQMFQAGVYATTQSGPSYLSGALAYSLHDVTTTRTSSLGGFATLKGQFDASVASSRLEAGHHIPLGGGLTATPYAAAEAQTMLLPSFAESSVAAASPFALDYASRTLADLRSELGGRFDADWSLAGKPLKLYSRLAWAHDFDNAGVEQATFLSLPSASFLVDTVKPPRDSALVSAGFDYGLAGGWSLGGKLDGEFSHTTSIYSATGEIKEVW
jgi:outer membrane autotransporter protein